MLLIFFFTFHDFLNVLHNVQPVKMLEISRFSEFLYFILQFLEKIFGTVKNQ